jgi:hypothetical protein
MGQTSKACLLFFFPVFTAASLSAQEPNPFRSIGKQTEIIDVSKGKYTEIIEKDSLERVGTALVNRHTRKIERFLDEDSLDNSVVDNTAQSRFFSVDKLAAKFPYYSPYQFAGNSPIWASDLDGLEPNFKHNEEGIKGAGLFDPLALGSIPRHQAVLTIGKPGRQFQLQWLLNDNGEAIGYLASRVVPEEEYKTLYGGRGTGLQPSYIIGLDEFGKFAKNIDKYYDLSHESDLDDVLYGEIESSPTKSLFDPRGWLLAEVGGATGRIAGQFFRAVPFFTKMERLAIFQSELGKAAPVGSQAEAIKLINKTLDQVEDTYSGIQKARNPTGDDGRMYGILDDKYIITLEDGTKVAQTRGNRIVLRTDGGFEIQSKDGKKTYFSKPGAKKD